MQERQTRTKSLGKTDIVLFTVSAILLLDTLTAAASVGTSSIFWWLFLGIFFFIPFAQICAEMGCTYPEQGGIYAWIRDAYGRRWGARASWAYWVNTAVWLPAINILFSGIFAQLFAPDLSLTAQIFIGILLTWLTILVNIVTLNVGKWIPNIGAIFKVIVFAAIIVGAVIHTYTHGMANPLTLQTLTPDWGESVKYMPAIIYGMLGFELISASSEEMKHPARDVPRSIFISGLIIISLYTMATIAVLAAIPMGEIDLVEGLMNTLYLFFGASALGKVFVLSLGVATLFTFFSNGVTWAIGCNRAAAEAAHDGELPKWFGLESRRRTPLGAALLMGVVSTLVLVLYGFLSTNNEDLFWSLFAFSAIIFLLPYLMMMLAFLKMRAVDGDRPRPYKVPGGIWGARIMAYTCFFILAACIVLFAYVPGSGMQWPVFIGASVTLVIGEIIIHITDRQRQPATPQIDPS